MHTSVIFSQYFLVDKVYVRERKYTASSVKTHIIFADLTDEFLGFVHGSRRWSKHRKSLLVHLIYRHTLRRNTKGVELFYISPKANNDQSRLRF